MDEKPKVKSDGLTRRRRSISPYLAGGLVCVMLLFASYSCKAFAGAVPAARGSGFPTLAPSSTSAPYIPAPSLTGWVVVSGTPVTVTATPPPTSTPPPTNTPLPTPTLRPTNKAERAPTSTPLPTSTPRPTNTPEGAPTATPIPPTATAQVGTIINPVPIGSGFTIADFGTLKVIRSSWVPGQTGLVVVQLSFVCRPPAGQLCATGTVVLTAIGGSGSRYRRAFDVAIPEPTFGRGAHSLLFDGATQTGNAGFIVQDRESSLMMQVQISQRAGQFYLWIGPPE